MDVSFSPFRITMKVYNEKEGKERKIKFSGTVKGLLKAMKLNPETVLVARKSELLTGDDNVDDSDEIKILSVISGG